MIRSDGRLTRARILAAGLDLAAVHGWETVKFQSISAELGDVSWQNVKHHYSNLAALHAAIVQHGREVLEVDARGRADLQQVQKRAALAIASAERLQLV